jgi:ribonuclease E
MPEEYKMKRMLINATQPEELRVAVADGQILIDLDIEVPSQEQKKANVYKGRITRVEPSLEACFVDFGSERHGFLPLKEICPATYQPSAKKVDGKVSIRDAVKEGQELIVQVEKEERGNKGAALTTYISLAGRYLVLMPTNPKAGGVSRRISGEDRQDLREQLQNVIAPDNVGIIVRTAGVGREAEELQWDLDYLVQLWSAIDKAAQEKPASFLIYQESNLFIRALRDHLRNDIGEILIDDAKVYQDAREFVQQVMPHNVRKLKHYQDDVPLFSRFQIETQIESAFARTVHLPSGGSLVIDHTEAMLSIDINSARATKGTDIEDTAYKTNLQAADEIARQLRLRDLGGLIVIDFIDMMDRKHQRQVEERLRHALQIDKARVQTGRISRFGLLEMSRQRLRPSLGESSQESCPRCNGYGTIRSIESLALSILRLLEEESMKDFTGQTIVQAPPKVANFLLNEKRKALSNIEARHDVPIIILANEYMQRPKFEIHRVRQSEITDEPSFNRIEQPQAELVASSETQAAAAVAAPAPVVTGVTHSRPAPTPVKKEKTGFFGQFFAKLFSGTEEEPTPAKKIEKKKQAGKKKTARRQAQQPRQGQQGQRRSGESRRGGSRRGGKKTTQRASEGSRQTKKTGRKKAASKKSQQTSGKPGKTTQQQKPSGGAPQEKKDGGSPRKGRRRRSPYQTGGSKQRDAEVKAQVGSEKTDTGARAGKPDDKPGLPVVKEAADKAPVKAEPKKTDQAKGKAGKKTAAKKEKSSQDSGAKSTASKEPKPAESRGKAKTARPKKDQAQVSRTNQDPAAGKTADKEDQLTSSAKKADEKGEKPVAARQSPSKVKPTKSAAEKKAPVEKSGTKQDSPAKARAGTVTPAAEPPQIQATRDSKGIYTLKSSSPAEQGKPSAPGSNQTPPSSAGAGD